MNVLLSIKPEFAEKILNGEKKYEFRKTRFRNPGLVDTVFLYASSPVKRIVGWFSLSDVIEGRPEVLWNRFEAQSGISERDRFMEYFSDSDTGYALEIEDSVEFEPPVNPSEYIEEFRPPVSFQYTTGDLEFVTQAIN